MPGPGPVAPVSDMARPGPVVSVQLCGSACRPRFAPAGGPFSAMPGPGPVASASDMAGPGPVASVSATGDCGHDPDSRRRLERGGEVVRALAVDVDVHERAHFAALVENEIRDRQAPQR